MLLVGSVKDGANTFSLNFMNGGNAKAWNMGRCQIRGGNERPILQGPLGETLSDGRAKCETKILR